MELFEANKIVNVGVKEGISPSKLDEAKRVIAEVAEVEDEVEDEAAEIN